MTTAPKKPPIPLPTHQPPPPRKHPARIAAEQTALAKKIAEEKEEVGWSYTEEWETPARPRGYDPRTADELAELRGQEALDHFDDWVAAKFREAHPMHGHVHRDTLNKAFERVKATGQTFAGDLEPLFQAVIKELPLALEPEGGLFRDLHDVQKKIGVI